MKKLNVKSETVRNLGMDANGRVHFKSSSYYAGPTSSSTGPDISTSSSNG